MQDPTDYELVKTDTEGAVPPPPPRPVGRWIVVAIVLAATLGGFWWYWWRSDAPLPAAAPEIATTEIPGSVEPLGGEPLEVEVPPLDLSDEFVRELVRGLSSHPRVAAWLATDGLIRNFTVVVHNIAEGNSPARQLQAIRPSGAFQVIERDAYVYVDPRSFGRYDDLAEAATSVSPAAVAELYTTLKPRIEEAHLELGVSSESFDATLERAIVHLLQTPVPSGPVPVEPIGVGYGFADERLEALSGAQKQLLRMGPENARLVQQSLREIALALGIPAARLPSL